MKNSTLLAALALSTLVLVAACEDDPAQPTGDSGTQTYLPLTTREAVLANLEAAWANRAPNEIDELLDDKFTFYFTPGDVADGLPEQWPRAAEMAATDALFKSNTVPILNAPVCTSIRIDLALEGVTWDPVPAASALGEVQYTATVNYDFTFKLEPNTTYNSEPGAKAQLTVREVAVGSGTEWRLVEWRDLGNDRVADRQAAATRETTWGAVKALYEDASFPSSREDVLYKLEAAWNQRSIGKVDEVLNEEFAFFFSDGDVGSGLPVQWPRTDELGATYDLFVSNSQPVLTGPVCTSVHVDLDLDPLQWVEIIPEDYPAETWYTTTVLYSATFEMYPDITFFVQPGAKAQFTVRSVGTEAIPNYELVEWRDLGASRLMGSAANTEETTWGGVKAIYRSGRRARLPLTTREAVLNNIEYAYDNRNTSAFDELLDLNFTFFFSDGDVGGGLPVQWARTDELGATNDLFISNSQPVPVGPQCRSIRMDLTLENLQWIEIIPEDHPGEIWYTTPINYDFTFKMLPDDTYNSVPGAKGQFTVRNVGTEEAPQWRLIEWRDLGSSLLASSRTATSTQESTWGGIKALYR